MEDVKTRTPKPLRIILVLLVTALVILSCMTFQAVHSNNTLQATVTELCGKSMKDIVLNLQEGGEISPESLYRYHEITQVYPDTYYAVLAETLLVLEDPAIASQLTQEDREHIADCIIHTYSEDMVSDDWMPLIYEIENILAPYIYN